MSSDSHAHGAKFTQSGEPIDYLNCARGIKSWLTSIDHKRIGLMYLYSIMSFFVIGGIAALAVRSELAKAGSQYLSAEQYNIAFTLHGAIMIFLFIVPGIPATMGNFLLPLMIGAKDVAFPRLNLFSLYIYWLGALLALVALFNPIDTGWTFYAPYSLQTSSGVILMTLAAFILGFSSILTGLNFIVTVHKLRAPGMTWFRLPVFVWATYATAIIQTLATPVVGITVILLLVERVMGIGIFDPAIGGDPVLFQHFFWFYSHPVVYIMVLPAFGVVGEIIPVFSKKPLFGYKAVVFSTIAIAGVSFIVWAHHMFVSGISSTTAKVFSVITFFVAIPTAVKVFNWVSTMYKGSIRFDTPMLYAMAFVFLFMVAGTTGVYLAILALDVYYHDTYFVVAHFHYTIQGGAVIGLIAALHFWFPKMSGKMYNEYVAKIAWFLIIVGFNATFIPQFILGMEGMPRRYYDYPVEYQNLHTVSTVFAFVNAFGYMLALVNLAYAARFGKVKAGENPYDSLSIEWKTQSPPIHENFETTPVVTDWTYGYGKDIPHGAA
jgi:cytochrome c oxidase subunit I